MLVQGSKLDWLLKGDDNTAYFHAIIRGGNKQTSILVLEDPNGKQLTSHKDIEGEVLRFYKDLVGTNTQRRKHIDIVAVRAGNQLKDDDRNSLTKPVTDQEILTALNSIGDNKAPGTDGYTAKVFKSTWKVIGVDVTDAIHDFFTQNRMYPTANCELVTLIPKKNDAKTMKI
ncbi:unnamed protein product [Vicia faba]|uniref:Uncharacterized protein n=1 Tax=Vicia faba TaxID=3906 RepID=A0AAV0ZI33_VICFA|nr:unnamed protein product [Vicia faba]CAI8598295.1 unnamed protein product [Vicia faba]